MEYDYFKEKVVRQRVKYIFPFEFDYIKFKDIADQIAEDFEEGLEEGITNYLDFLPLFNDYFFNVNSEKKKAYKNPYCRDFILDKKLSIDIRDKEVKIETSKPKDEAYPYIKRAYLKLFKFGVGFLILSTDYNWKSEPKSLDKVNETDRIICDKVGIYFEAYKLNKYEDINFVNTRRGITYECIELEKNTFCEEHKQNIVLRTCSAVKTTYITDSDELKAELEQKYLTRGEHVFYGFSRSCGVQFILESDSEKKDHIKRLVSSFMNDRFYVFIFAMQQRNIMRMFAHKLVTSNQQGKRAHPGKLQADFIDFITHGMLNDISDNNVITKFYKRWTNIFDSANIYEEVSKKLNVVDEYKQTQFSRKMELISAIIFPALFIGNIVTVGLLKTEDAVSFSWNQMMFLTIGAILIYPLYKFIFRTRG